MTHHSYRYFYYIQEEEMVPRQGIFYIFDDGRVECIRLYVSRGHGATHIHRDFTLFENVPDGKQLFGIAALLEYPHMYTELSRCDFFNKIRDVTH